MAISTIKYDEHGNPKRAKYCLVALGNHEQSDWSKDDTFAPVLSMLQIRLLTMLAIKHCRRLKSCDIKQAFVEALLPHNERYIVQPPHGITNFKNSYMLLKKLLYGLRRAPRHFFDKLRDCLVNKLGLKQCPNAPCIFYGTLIPGQPPIYIGTYVDDLIFFSASDKVELQFQQLLDAHFTVDWQGQVTHYLGIRFQWTDLPENNLQVHMSQEAYIDQLLQTHNLIDDAINTKQTPYCSGYPVDAIPTTSSTTKENLHLQSKLRSIVGSMNWLSLATRPDIMTITNMLAQYQHKATYGHIEAAKYALKYLKGTKQLGICFSSQHNQAMESYVKFPILPDKITALCDANWGPQDQSTVPQHSIPAELETFKSQSISGFLIYLLGPLDWCSRRQRLTAHSSCESEIYATDECIKQLTHIRHILDDLEITDLCITNPIPVYNDNSACVNWSKHTTSRSI